MNRSAWGVLLFLPALALAQSGVWQDLGPSPSVGGQVENIPDREVVGAVNALAAHPTNADILYAGAVNGGIWRTNNATATSPIWSRLTDTLGSLSIGPGTLEFDPTDANRLTLVAGTGRTSSLSGIGGSLIGMLRSVDGGQNWTVLAGTGGTLAGQQIRGVAARGATLLAATSNGLFRSIDTGITFAAVSGAAGSGLPAGNSTDLTPDSTSNSRFYLPVTSGTPGVYRSNDSGATWSRVSDSTMDTAIDTARVRLAVGAAGQVYVAVIRSGRLSNVFRSSDGSSGWTDLGIPTTTEASGFVFGAHAGGQGGTHFSIAADPTDVNVVYLAGDRQPHANEGPAGASVAFPNSLGARDFSARAFRGQFGGTPVWRPLTHSGTSNNSSPHADSRDMAFDAAGSLLESDDGGVYRRTQPNSTAGLWQSVNGSLQTTEYHNLSYDSLSNRVIGGAQDNGTPEEDDTAIRRFRSVSTADGGDVGVNDTSSATLSTRYSSFQNLGAFRRRTVNASNVVQSTAFPTLTPLDGVTLAAQFVTPLAVNTEVGERLIIGGNNGVFESLTQGDSISRISTLRITQIVGSPLVYGIPGNADLLFFASGTGVHLRTTSGGAISALTPLASTVVDITMDPSINPAVPPGTTTARLFAITSADVFFSNNAGTSFANVTGNLVSGFAPGALRSMTFISQADAALIVGTDRGVFVSRSSTGFSTWSRLGAALPNAPVFELEYDSVDQVLIAGMLGRGAWKLTQPLDTNLIFANGFE